MISVIVPFFNNADFLHETLSSVSQQTIENWECVLVDDGSTDNSLDIVKTFTSKDSRFKCYSRPSKLPKGANTCRNFAVEKCNGTHLLFLDADDILSTHCLEVRESKIGNQDLMVFSTAHFTENTQEGIPFFPNLNRYFSRIVYRNMFLDYVIPWHSSSGLWSKSFYEKLGGFDPELLRFQDVELHARALGHPDLRFKLDFTHGYTSYYRKSAFHTEVSLDKRRFILDQGFLFADKLKEQLQPHDFAKSEGLFIYLLFRFEEVVNLDDISKVKDFFAHSDRKKYPDLKGDLGILVNLYEKVLTKPSRFRKYLSYIIYRKFRFTLVRKLVS